MSYREARSLTTLKAELDTAAPRRSTLSDGWIGDAAHASRSSDHNPWIIVGGVGVVRARDFTHDPEGGLDCNALAEELAGMLREGTHPALGSGAYVIWRGRIISRDRISEGWRPYSGSNPHDKHLHLSVTTRSSGFDSTARWAVLVPAKPKPKKLPPRVQTALSEILIEIKRIRAAREVARGRGEPLPSYGKAIKALREARQELRKAPKR